jgi:glutamine amidotransferase
LVKEDDMIVIFDYGVGNLTSIMKMINKSGKKAIISGDRDDLEKASKIILPGMGHFDHCMRKFNESGMRDLITNRVMNERIPLLGICVGLQMFFSNSEEGTEQGLGWIQGNVVRFNEARFQQKLTVPNMGWLDVQTNKDNPVLDDLSTPRFYFAHSYHVVADNPEDVLLSADYGYRFTAAVALGNIVGVQFHPEKSHRFGMQLLQNFSDKS